MTLYEGALHHIFDFPNFSVSGSITGMRKVYGRNALLVRCGSFVYHVTEEIYNAAS